MKILDEKDIAILDFIVNNEIGFINKGFEASELLGKVFISNSINSFVDNNLKKLYGDIVPQFSSEYRYFIVGLLKGIDDKFKDIALKEVLIPTIRRIKDEELLSALNIDEKEIK